MQHLNADVLARLVDEAATEAERGHLAGCAACRAELEALREQTANLAELHLVAAPERAWPLLAARLEREGLVARPGAARTRAWRGAGLLRAAGYVALFLAGGLSALAWERGTGWPAAGDPLAADATTVDAASARLREAETAYLAALARYEELVEPERGADPAARLAALEGIVLSTRAALDAAPADPMLNGYYLTAVGQRDAVLRQISQGDADPWF